MSRRRKIIAAFITLIVLVLACFVVWAETPLGPMPEVSTSLESDSKVYVTEGKWLVFRPASSNYTTGFIIYPGGRVDPRSYAPIAHEIATEGYLVIIVPMPLNLAVLGVNTATGVIDSYPDVQKWVVGGHSLGGTMAAQFAYGKVSKVRGLALWAAYPASGTDLSNQNIAVTTIHGSNDGLVTKTQIDTSLRLLPPEAVRIEITGGNHAQFGWYGSQPGDNEAAITRKVQQDEVFGAMTILLQKVELLAQP